MGKQFKKSLPCNNTSYRYKWLTKGVYLISTKNSITKTVSALKNEHLKLYSKFGGLSIEKTFDIYGDLPNPSVVSLWDASKISNFFKRAFLKKLKVS